MKKELFVTIGHSEEELDRREKLLDAKRLRDIEKAKANSWADMVRWVGTMPLEDSL